MYHLFIAYVSLEATKGDITAKSHFDVVYQKFLSKEIPMSSNNLSQLLIEIQSYAVDVATLEA